MPDGDEVYGQWPWDTYELRARVDGSEITVALDGETMLHVIDDTYPNGTIGLTAHGCTIGFHDLEVEAIGSDPCLEEP